MFEWDEAKRRSNLSKHAADFEWVENFDWKGAMRLEDARKDYGETRYIALGYIDDTLYFCSYTHRGINRRIISLRRANKRERVWYEEACEDQATDE